MGVSVEDRAALSRLRHLRQTPSARRFVSAEPLLESLGPVDFSGFFLVIVGGESGPGHRPMREEWVLEIRDICEQQDVDFFFKQWGGATPRANGRLLQGREYNAPRAMGR